MFSDDVSTITPSAINVQTDVYATDDAANLSVLKDIGADKAKHRWNCFVEEFTFTNKRTNGPVNAHLRYVLINLFDYKGNMHA